MDVHGEINRLDDVSSDSTSVLQTGDNSILLPIELTNTALASLQHLNDDCLHEIFSSSSLKLMDLCSLAETCTRFKQITQRVFPKSYGILFKSKYRGYWFISKGFHRYHSNMHYIERVLRSFGSRLTKLSIGYWDQDVVDLVSKYCEDATLTSLKIFRRNSIAKRMHMDSIFQRLVELTIYKCDLIEDVSSPHFNFVSLIELKILYSSDCAAILNSYFSKLEKFTWNFSLMYTKEIPDNENILCEFIKRHENLKNVNVEAGSVHSSELIHAINNSCKDLVELTLTGLVSATLPVVYSTDGSLAKLKILHLDFGDKEFSQSADILKVLTSLETLKLSSLYSISMQNVTIIFNVLCQLHHLWELHLSDCSFYFAGVPWTMLTQLRKLSLCGPRLYLEHIDIPNIILQLINLEDLKCVFYCQTSNRVNFHLSRELLYTIGKVVERREHVLTLRCRYDFQLEENYNENQKVKLVKLNDDDVSDED